MKTSTLITVALLITTACFGWFNHLQLTKLKTTHYELVQQAKAQGISVDPSRPRSRTSSAKYTHRPSEEETKNLAEEFISYAEDMELLGQEIHWADKATRQRMIDQMDQIMALNGKQLKILIAEILAADHADEHIRHRLVAFLIKDLTKDNPHDALKILIDTPDLLVQMSGTPGCRPHELIYRAFRQWSSSHPVQSLIWFREHHSKLPETSINRFEFSLIYGSAASDLRLAFKLFDEFKKPPMKASYLLSQVDQTPAGRTAALTPLREWISSIPDAKMRERVYCKSLAKLAFGQGGTSASFESTTRWIEKAQLTPKELKFFTRPDLFDLGYHIKPAEAGQWVEWLGRTFSADVSRSRIRQLATDHRTTSSVKTWLATAPESPTKDIVREAIK